MNDFTASALLLPDDFRFKPTREALAEELFANEEPLKQRVLVVDDEKLIADTTTEVLKGAGFEAKAAYDGWSALELIDRYRPACLLTDVMMPQMNGVELAIAIRKMQPNIRIVLFSGQAGIADILRTALQEGHEFDLIAKPLHPSKLIEHIRQTLR